MRIDYTFDGNSFAGYGVYIEKSGGLLGKTKRKSPETYEYPGENGFIPDLVAVVYEARTITLSCLMLADSAIQLITVYESFTSILYNKTALCVLNLKIDGVTRLSFNCYVKEVSDMSKSFRDGRNAGEFTITFIEPKPYE
jgi:hypothetical protein